VGGVLIRDGRALIIRRVLKEGTFPGVWEIPNGGIVFGEDPTTAIKRQFKEATGMEVVPVTVVNAFCYQTAADGEERHTVQINYAVRSPSPKILLKPGMHDKFAWVDERDIDKCGVMTQTANDMKAAFTLMRKVI